MEKGCAQERAVGRMKALDVFSTSLVSECEWGCPPLSAGVRLSAVACVF